MTRFESQQEGQLNAEQLLLIVFGMLAGGCLGYLTKWRQDRKLEHHGVRLSEWDTPFDMQAPKANAKLLPMDRQSQR